ncbi:acyl-CoA dehydrogenase family protein [Sedimentitalea sp. JM2-8]|uniref:Acyl-CoA dehydrogenase family protein n=1 Tax=Sedimentitalea xiamensis TaxID=3050037 RepID=A0ABT7F9Q4_9RHOB|nr:acyl-CoA dehydrogenase family protein [Sedimentitalea xiamensis]MDK3071826.1 acyl-CoA dehydrogenase family protein [Sedimentitalea xiamensis]
MTLSYFDDTHEMIRDTARTFVEREIRPHIDEWEEAGGFPREIYKKAGDAGLLGIGYPEELGGTGGDVFQKVVWVEELMRAGSGGLVASLGSLDIGMPPLVRFGSDALKRKILPQVLAGEKIYALAITEPGGGSDVAGLKTRAERKTIGNRDYYQVNGSKTFVTSGFRADYYTVAVRTGEEGHKGVSLIVVPRDTEGFSTGQPLKKMGWWASDTAELFFENCLVPVENLIGEEGRGFPMITSNFQSERLTLAVMANVTAELALDAAQTYARDRRAFGTRLSGHQAIRHKLADMATRLEASRAFTYSCGARMEAGETIFKEISMAKNFATDVCDQITYDAVQIFGGMGYMRESLVERLYRDARILSIGGGTREIMNEIIAKQMGL